MRPQLVVYECAYKGKRLEFAGYHYLFTGVITTDFGNRYCYQLAR